MSQQSSAGDSLSRVVFIFTKSDQPLLILRLCQLCLLKIRSWKSLFNQTGGLVFKPAAPPNNNLPPAVTQHAHKAVTAHWGYCEEGHWLWAANWLNVFSVQGVNFKSKCHPGLNLPAPLQRDGRLWTPAGERAADGWIPQLSDTPSTH